MEIKCRTSGRDQLRRRGRASGQGKKNSSHKNEKERGEADIETPVAPSETFRGINQLDANRHASRYSRLSAISKLL